MFHVYKKGYTTLPDLKKINLDDVFEKNRSDSPAIQREKVCALKNEDFLIHRIDDQKDYLSSVHVCFPSHWYPEDKIGKSFNEIHQPVPMNLKNSDKLVRAMVNGGIFERFVWSIVYEKNTIFIQI